MPGRGGGSIPPGGIDRGAGVEVYPLYIASTQSTPAITEGVAKITSLGSKTPENHQNCGIYPNTNGGQHVNFLNFLNIPNFINFAAHSGIVSPFHKIRRFLVIS